MARPRKTLYEQKVKLLAAKGLSLKEIALQLDCSDDTLSRRYAGAIKKGHDLRNASLARRQFELAMTGNCTMLIWLGKQYLGQR